MELVDRATHRQPPIPPDAPSDVDGNCPGGIGSHAYELEPAVETPTDITMTAPGKPGLTAANAADAYDSVSELH